MSYGISRILARIAECKRRAPAKVEALGYSIQEYQYTSLRKWMGVIRELGLKIRKEPSRFVNHYAAQDSSGFTVATFNEDSELSDKGFGSIPSRFFDRNGHIKK